MNPKNFPERVKIKKAEALTRQEEYSKLSLQDKLDRLPKDGAKKQRAKLQKLLSKNKTA